MGTNTFNELAHISKVKCISYYLIKLTGTMFFFHSIERLNANIQILAQGEQDHGPATKAVARYLNIDLTPEGEAARNRCGIAIVVHGPPQSGIYDMNITFELKSHALNCF